MFKSLLLSVVCGSICIVNASQDTINKPENVMGAKPETPVMAKDKTLEEKQPAVNEAVRTEEQEIEAWINSMSAEEQAQFLDEMNAALDSEITTTTAAADVEASVEVAPVKEESAKDAKETTVMPQNDVK